MIKRCVVRVNGDEYIMESGSRTKDINKAKVWRSPKTAYAALKPYNGELSSNYEFVEVELSIVGVKHIEDTVNLKKR